MVVRDAGVDELTGSPRLVMAGRGDHYAPFLTAALERRLGAVERVDTELTSPERLLVAATSFRPSRRAWQERFYKSGLGWSLRSRRAHRGLAALGPDIGVVLQGHALFGVDHPRATLYVDNTHRQSMEHWPAWNPLRGRALARWLRRERALYHRYGHLFAICQTTADSLITDYGVPVDRVSVVGAGPNVASLPTVAPRSDPGEAPVILMVGNDWIRKGGEVLLEAFALVREQIPGAVLRLVGDETPASGVPGVDSVGRVGDRDELAAIFDGADVFCLPSLFEPFALSLLEAMAFGLPCVSTRTGGVPDMITDGEHGRLVEPGDPVALAAALVEVLTTPGLAVRMGRAGRAQIETTYTWDHVVDRMRPALVRLAATGTQDPAYSPTDSRFMTPSSGSSSSPRTP